MGYVCNHKGYEIRTRSGRREIIIERDVGRARGFHKFVIPDQWDGGDATVIGTLQFGREIIDGMVKGHTVAF